MKFSLWGIVGVATEFMEKNQFNLFKNEIVLWNVSWTLLYDGSAMSHYLYQGGASPGRAMLDLCQGMVVQGGMLVEAN